MAEAFSPNTLFVLDEWWPLCRVCKSQHTMQNDTGVACRNSASIAKFRAISYSRNLIISARLHLINITLTRAVEGGRDRSVL